MRLLHSVTQFVRTTIVGGMMFLVPVVIIALVLGKAMQLASGLAKPLSEALPVIQVAGVGTVTLLAALLLLAVSFLAGVVARTSPGRRMSQWFEESFLGGLPQYQVMKSMAAGLAHVEKASHVNPVLVSIEDAWQIGYLLETLDNNWVAVFLPQAPTPMSGNVMYMPAKRVRPLDITMIQAMAIVKRLGVGSAAALRGVDLTLPAGA